MHVWERSVAREGKECQMDRTLQLCSSVTWQKYLFSKKSIGAFVYEKGKRLHSSKYGWSLSVSLWETGRDAPTGTMIPGFLNMTPTPFPPGQCHRHRRRSLLMLQGPFYEMAGAAAPKAPQWDGPSATHELWAEAALRRTHGFGWEGIC